MTLGVPVVFSDSGVVCHVAGALADEPLIWAIVLGAFGGSSGLN